jgi:hypothetical protein
MRADVKNVLRAAGVQVELKGYKEHKVYESYYMQGTMYVQGKKAIQFTDRGDGGECHLVILNDANAEPLLNIEPELAKLPAYERDDLMKRTGSTESDSIIESMVADPYTLTSMFYAMAEDLLEFNRMKVKAKKSTMVKFGGVTYADGSYEAYAMPIGERAFLNIVAELLKKPDCDQHVQIWNLDQEWKTYTLLELQKILKLYENERKMK